MESPAASSGQSDTATAPVLEASPTGNAPSQAEVCGDDTIYCCSCHYPTTIDKSLMVVRACHKQKEVRRCTKCHSLRSRVNRICSKHGHLAQDWTKVSDADKRKFMQDAQDKCGEELLMRMQESITHSTRKSTSVQFKGTGNFLDKQDLQEKYKNKPDQLESILAKTRTMWHPTRNVMVYEDVDFVLTTCDEEQTSEEHKRKVEFAENPKAKRKATIKTKVGADATVQAEEKLKGPEKKKLAKKADAAKTTKLSLLDTISKANTLKAFIPAYVMKSAGTEAEKMQATIDKVQAALNAGTGNKDTLITDLDSCIESGAAAASRLKVQIEQAEAFQSEGGDKSA